MANPQLENGHFRLANEIVDALIKANLTSREWRVIMFVIRKTYGWNKKMDFISLSQYASGTGLSRENCHRTIRRLLKRNMLTVAKIANSQTLCYGFQKDYEKWTLLPKHTPVAKIADAKLAGTVAKVDEKVLVNLTTTKDIYTKDTLTKDISLVPTPKVGTPEWLAELWNSTCLNLPKLLKLTKARKNKVTLRLKENPDPAWWLRVLTHINSTPFLCGQGDRGWKASFDWLVMNPENCLKVLEGKYDGDAKTRRSAGQYKPANLLEAPAGKYDDFKPDAVSEGPG